MAQNFDAAKKELAELMAKAMEEAQKSGEAPPVAEGAGAAGEAALLDSSTGSRWALAGWLAGGLEGLPCSCKRDQ
jgi:AcrR family transcriptional regulator